MIFLELDYCSACGISVDDKLVWIPRPSWDKKEEMCGNCKKKIKAGGLKDG